jgi:hypothetical protein
MKYVFVLLFLITTQYGVESLADPNILWNDIFVCDREAFHVQIDPLERRHVQVTITDSAAIYSFSSYPNIIPVEQPDALFKMYGPNRSMPLTAVAQSWVTNGIFSESDFKGLSIAQRNSSQVGGVPGLRLYEINGGMQLDILSGGNIVRNWFFKSCAWNPYGNP